MDIWLGWKESQDLVGLSGLKESRTLAKILDGESLARFGDGELKLCHGEDSLTQVWSEAIQTELRDILEDSPCHVGIPHTQGLRPDYWGKFLKTHSDYLNPDTEYGSAFISRPNEAGLDSKFFRRMSKLWQGRDVTLITGGGSLSTDHLHTAKSVRVVDAPVRDAYVDFSRIEADSSHLVILCLGATATILADRLTRKGVQAVDLGFVGKFL